MSRKKQEPAPVEASPKSVIQQQIANLCTNIGDQSFIIRQANSAITGYYSQIDKLRAELQALEAQNGSENSK